MKPSTRKKNHLFTPAIAAGILMAGSTAHAASVIASADSRGRQGTSAQSPTITDTALLGIGPVSGSDAFFRTYLTFNLTSESAATTVSLTVFSASENENNTTTNLVQNFTLFSLASNWNNASNNPLPGGTDLATFTTTLSSNPDGDITFSSAALTSAFHAAVGGTLYLGIYSPEGEAAASGTRAFQWFRPRDVGGSSYLAGEEPTLTYTPIPEPSAALLGSLGLLALLRRRR
jgi:hypothetical protein